MASPPSGLFTVSDYESAATVMLPTQVKGYINGGAEDEVTLKESKRAFQDYAIRPFCLRDVSACSLSTSFLSLSLAHPIGIAPTALHKLAHPEGELATVRGAKTANALMIAASWSTTSLEEMKSEAGDHPMWFQWYIFQLYVYKDRSQTQSIVKRAEAAGYSAIVVTVDTPLPGRRLATRRSNFQLPPDVKFANFTVPSDWKAAADSKLLSSSYDVSQLDPSVTWTCIRKLVESTSLPVIVKGILRGDDAVEAVESGVKGIIVSNHGGRQLDSTPASIQVVREIAEAVRSKVPVWMDGGVRNGRDVFKALALGATGVFVGRPVLWGLTVAGETGVAHVLEMLRKELEDAMKLAGCPTIESIRDAKNVVVHKSFFARY